MGTGLVPCMATYGAAPQTRGPTMTRIQPGSLTRLIEHHVGNAGTPSGSALSRVEPEAFTAGYADGGALFVERLTHLDAARQLAGLVPSSDVRVHFVLVAMYDLPDEDDTEKDGRRIDKVLIDRGWRSLDRAIEALQAARTVRS